MATRQTVEVRPGELVRLIRKDDIALQDRLDLALDYLARRCGLELEEHLWQWWMTLVKREDKLLLQGLAQGRDWWLVPDRCLQVDSALAKNVPLATVLRLLAVLVQAQGQDTAAIRVVTGLVQASVDSNATTASPEQCLDLLRVVKGAPKATSESLSCVEGIVERCAEEPTHSTKLAHLLVDEGLTVDLVKATWLGEQHPLVRLTTKSSFPWSQIQALVQAEDFTSLIYFQYIQHNPDSVTLPRLLLDHLSRYLAQRGTELFPAKKSKSVDVNALRAFCFRLSHHLESLVSGSQWSLRLSIFHFCTSCNVFTHGEGDGSQMIRRWTMEIVDCLDRGQAIVQEATELLFRMIESHFDTIRPSFPDLWFHAITNVLPSALVIKIARSYEHYRDIEAFFDEYSEALMTRRSTLPSSATLDCPLTDMEYLKVISGMAASPLIKSKNPDIYHRLTKRILKALGLGASKKSRDTDNVDERAELPSQQHPHRIAGLIALMSAYVAGLPSTEDCNSKDQARLSNAVITVLDGSIFTSTLVNGHGRKRKRRERTWHPALSISAALLHLRMCQNSFMAGTMPQLILPRLQEIDLSQPPVGLFLMFWIALMELQNLVGSDVVAAEVDTERFAAFLKALCFPVASLPPCEHWSGKIFAIKDTSDLASASRYLLIRQFPSIVSHLQAASSLSDDLAQLVITDEHLSAVVLHSAEYAEFPSYFPALVSYMIRILQSTGLPSTLERQCWTFVARAPTLRRPEIVELLSLIFRHSDSSLHDTLLAVIRRALSLAPSAAFEVRAAPLLSFARAMNPSQSRILAVAFADAWSTSEKAISYLDGINLEEPHAIVFIIFLLHRLKSKDSEPYIERHRGEIQSTLIALMDTLGRGASSLISLRDDLLIFTDLLTIKTILLMVMKESFACLSRFLELAYHHIGNDTSDGPRKDVAHLLLKASTILATDELQPVAHAIALQKLLKEDVPGLAAILAECSAATRVQGLRAITQLVDIAMDDDRLGAYFSIATAMIRSSQSVDSGPAAKAGTILISRAAYFLGSQSQQSSSVLAFLDAVVGNLNCSIHLAETASILAGLSGLLQPSGSVGNESHWQPKIFIQVCDLLITLVRLRQELVRRTLHLFAPVLGNLLTLFQRLKPKLTAKERSEAQKRLPKWLNPYSIDQEAPAYSRAFSRVMTTLMAKTSINIHRGRSLPTAKAMSLAKPFSFLAAPVLSYHLATYGSGSDSPFTPISMVDRTGLWTLCEAMGERGRDGLMATSTPVGREILKRLCHEFAESKR